MVCLRRDIEGSIIKEKFPLAYDFHTFARKLELKEPSESNREYFDTLCYYRESSAYSLSEFIKKQGTMLLCIGTYASHEKKTDRWGNYDTSEKGRCKAELVVNKKCIISADNKSFECSEG